MLKGARSKAGNAKEKHKARGVGRGTQMTDEDLERVVNVLKRCQG
jgi:hypothetical protein